MPDFYDATKLGSGNEMVDRLTNLIAIFENKALDFSKNRADDDDILGDAYEYLMRHFATESGKSKQKKTVDKGWTCDLIPKNLVVERFFLIEKKAIEALEVKSEAIAGQLIEMEEEHSADEGYFAELEKVNKGNVQSRLKEIKDDPDAREEQKVLVFLIK